VITTNKEPTVAKRPRAKKEEPKRRDAQWFTHEHSEGAIESKGFLIPISRNARLPDFAKDVDRPSPVVQLWANKGHFDTLVDISTDHVYVHPEALKQLAERRKRS
jgi:hypothetical protein